MRGCPIGEPTPATPASKYFAATVAMIAGPFFFAVGAGLLPIPGGPSNLMDAGVTKGNYSARAILKAALPRDRSAFKRRFGLEFDF